MTELALFFSSPEQAMAREYMLDSFDRSPMMRLIEGIFRRQGHFTLVTRSEPPPNADYYTDWSNHSCDDWLISNVLIYLSQPSNTVVLFEEFDALSGGKIEFTYRAGPPYFVYGNRVFWPVTSAEASNYSVAQAMSWSVTFRKLAIFSLLPNEMTFPRNLNTLSEDMLREVGLSITRLVTDVYDGGGFMVWNRVDAHFDEAGNNRTRKGDRSNTVRHAFCARGIVG